MLGNFVYFFHVRRKTVYDKVNLFEEKLRTIAEQPFLTCLLYDVDTVQTSNDYKTAFLSDLYVIILAVQ